MGFRQPRCRAPSAGALPLRPAAAKAYLELPHRAEGRHRLPQLDDLLFVLRHEVVDAEVGENARRGDARGRLEEDAEGVVGLVALVAAVAIDRGADAPELVAHDA